MPRKNPYAAALTAAERELKQKLKEQDTARVLLGRLALEIPALQGIVRSLHSQKAAKVADLKLVPLPPGVVEVRPEEPDYTGIGSIVPKGVIEAEEDFDHTLPPGFPGAGGGFV